MPRKLVLELIHDLPTAEEERAYAISLNGPPLTNLSGANPATELLRKLGDAGRNILLSLLQHECPEVREKALHGLRHLSYGEGRSFQDILPCFADPVPNVRRAAIRAFAAVNGLNPDVPVAFLHGKSTRDGYEATGVAFQDGTKWCLGALAPYFANVLVQLFGGHRADAGFALAETLWGAGPDVVAGVADELYSRVDVELSGRHWEEGLDYVLTRFGTAAVEVSGRRLLDGDLRVRLFAAECLRNAPDTACVLPTLVAALERTRHQPDLRLQRGMWLGRPSTEFQQSLWSTCQDRRSLIVALGAAGEGALPTLAAGLRDPEADGCFVDTYLRAVSRLGPLAAPLVTLVGKHLASEDIELEELATVALGCIGPPAADFLDELTRKLEAPAPEPENLFFRSSTRTRLLTAIARIDPSRAAALVPRILDEMSAEDFRGVPDVIVAAGDAALPAIAAAIRADHPCLWAIAECLPKFGLPAVPLLLEVWARPIYVDVAVQGIESIGPAAREWAVELLATGYPASRRQFLKRAAEPVRDAVFDDYFPTMVRLSARPAVATPKEVERLLDVTFAKLRLHDPFEATDPTDRLVLDHMASLSQSKYLQYFRTFWCVGFIDREAMRTGGRALALAPLQDVLVRWRDRSGAANLRVSNGYLRDSILALEGLFDTGPLYDLWGPAEAEVSFRIEGFVKPSQRWGPRADRVWRWIDLFLARHRLRPVPGGDPGPNAAIDPPTRL